MRWPHKILAGAGVVVLAALVVLAQPHPSTARANAAGSIACGAANGGVGALGGVVEDVTGGAIGSGNPLGDLCNKVAGEVTGAITSPVASALKGVGDDVFKELTNWVAQGAGWLMGQVVEAIGTSTTPHLNRAGFLSEYAKMSALAVLLGVAALLAAILQGIAQGNAGLMLRVVLVNTPLAFLGTSVAFVVVQLLVGATDSLCHAISAGTGDHGSQFFEAAIADLGKVGGDVGEAGTGGGISGAQAHNFGQVAVPLFVGFLLAVVGAIAALCVLLELLMRDAGIYAVSLFMPFALYASISPRWRGVMRKYAEGLFALIESKFIIVAIITLAATLVTRENTTVEVVLVATSLMAVACFSPLFLFRIVAISEGAAAASFGRRSAGGAVVGGATRTVQTARTVQRMAGSDERKGGGSGVKLWNAENLAQSRPAPPKPQGGEGAKGRDEAGTTGGQGNRSPNARGGEGPPRPPGAGPGSQGPSGAGAAGAAGGAGTAAGAAAAVGAQAAKAPQKGAERISDTGVAKSAAERGGAGAGGEGNTTKGAAEPGGREQKAGTAAAGGPTERRPRPDASPAAPDDGGPTGGPSEGEHADRPPRPRSQPPESPDGETGDSP